MQSTFLKGHHELAPSPLALGALHLVLVEHLELVVELVLWERLLESVYDVVVVSFPSAARQPMSCSSTLWYIGLPRQPGQLGRLNLGDQAPVRLHLFDAFDCELLLDLVTFALCTVSPVMSGLGAEGRKTDSFVVLGILSVKIGRYRPRRGLQVFQVHPVSNTRGDKL